jgi:hypothetical protein
MSEKTFKEKFIKEKNTLERALDRTLILPIDKPKLWKKILKHFEDKGVEFYGEIEADYIMILNHISKELEIPTLI